VVKEWKSQGYPKKGCIVVYSDANGSTLKVYQSEKAADADHAGVFIRRHMLKSLNPDFPDVDPVEGGQIDAVFVEVIGQPSTVRTQPVTD
jgi:hypothetical protein